MIIRLPTWRNNSVSQYEARLLCMRKWALRSLFGQRGQVGAGAWRGRGLHGACEYRLLTGEVCRTEADATGHPLAPSAALKYGVWEYQTYVDALDARGFFPPTGEKILVEHRFHTPGLVGPDWQGVVDLAWGRRSDRLLIRDWKSHSTFDFVKTPEQLREDLQCNLYALWADEPEVEVELVNVEVLPRGTGEDGPDLQRLPKPPRAWRGKTAIERVKIMPVSVVIRREDALRVWEETRNGQRAMLRASETYERWEDVVPDTTACDKFGGCEYRELCGIPAEDKSVKYLNKYQAEGPRLPQGLDEKERGDKKMGYMDKYKDAPAASAQEPAAAAADPLAEYKAKIAAEYEAKLAQARVDLASAAAKREEAKSPGPADARAALAQGARPNQVIPDDAPARDAYRSEAKEAPVPAAAIQPEKSSRGTRKPRGPVPAAAPTPAPPQPQRAPEFDSAPAGTPDGTWVPDPAEVVAVASVARAVAGVAIEGPLLEQQSPNEPSIDEQTRPACVLYVDCYPIKGEPYVTLLEDWVGPVLEQLSRDVFEDKKLHHYELLGYGEKHAALALAVNDLVRRRGLPSALYASSSSGTARDVLPLVIPHAAVVVRRIGG